MISVITPTYETDPGVLARTWTSLKNQTHTDWEWVVWDDSVSDNTYRQLYGYCNDERYTINLHRSHKNIGNIGMVKLSAFMQGNGDLLVELDHDDELVPTALEELWEAYLLNSAEFFYSNCCEINSAGESCKYPEGWAFGYGSEYYDDEYGVWVMRAPEINATTMSHIVSMPNHVRAWDRSVYQELGGHNPSYKVADDYELMVRTMLKYNYYHIDKLLYKQYIGNTTAQRVHNAEIQQRVAEISNKYADDIKDKFA
jgi:glycosyltransferase involved in cell wall biosynthesis